MNGLELTFYEFLGGIPNCEIILIYVYLCEARGNVIPSHHSSEPNSTL